MGIKTQQIHLRTRPQGLPTTADFVLVDVDLPDLQEGQVLVRNLWMSVDPYMRRSMEEEAKDLVPWPVGGALDGPSVGEVVESRNSAFKPGDIVEAMCGWQQHFISDGTAFVPYLTAPTAIAKRTAPGADPRDYVGVLGIASMTAYAAMACLSTAVPGDTVVISSGAGTVGSIACQIAKIKGLRVVTSAGSDEKVEWLREEIGVDHAFNYRSQPIGDALAAACPQGIDFVLENASPEHLSSCLPLMNELKQILIAGFVSIYSNGGRVAAFPNFEFVLDRYLTIRAFQFMECLDQYDQFVSDMIKWRAEGRIAFRETHFHGLARAPEALCALFQENAGGKLLVKLD
ncbi:COG2130 Putative NADP-dependent oxidoreductases [Sphingomonadaceae bacterium]